jgi:hypothetical protein
MMSKSIYVLAFMTCLMFVLHADAGVRNKAVQEAFEYVSKKFGREVAEEGVEQLSSKMMRLASQHGDELVAAAFKKIGPRAGKLAGEAGEHGGLALKLLSQHGDSAVSLVAKPSALSAVARYGDDAAEAFIKHGSVGEKLVGTFAREGAEALVKVTPQNGRRLAMLSADGTLKPELMSVVTRYGDEACEFIWRNKAALATGAVVATFVASPEPYLQGTQQLVSTVAESAVKPLAELPRAVATEAAAHTNWTPIVILLLLGLGGAGWYWSRNARMGNVLLGVAINRALGHGRRDKTIPPRQNGGSDGTGRN